MTIDMLFLALTAIVACQGINSDAKPIEIHACAGTNVLKCCQEVVRYIIASRGQQETTFERTPANYLPIEVFKSDLNGRPGWLFGCSSYDLDLRTDAFGEAYPLFMACLPGQQQAQEEFIVYRNGKCVDAREGNERRVNWNEARASLQIIELNGVATITKLYQYLQHLIADRQQKRDWRQANYGRLQRAWDDEIERKRARAGSSSHGQDTRRACSSSPRSDFHCFDLEVPYTVVGFEPFGQRAISGRVESCDL